MMRAINRRRDVIHSMSAESDAGLMGRCTPIHMTPVRRHLHACSIAPLPPQSYLSCFVVLAGGFSHVV